jgi:hypothetical protein
VDVCRLVECVQAWQKIPGKRGPTALLVPAMVIDHQTCERREGHQMDTTYEYKFVRLGEYRGSAWFGVSDKVRNAYESTRGTAGGWCRFSPPALPRSAPPSTTS